MYEFMLYALLAGVLLAFTAAPLGCFVVWRKMAYFGDALSHSALLGIVAGMLLHLPTLAGVIPVALFFALGLSGLSDKTRFAADTLMAIMAQGCLALGVVILTMSPLVQVDMMAFLFGDILAVTATDLVISAVLALMICGILWHNWRVFVLITLSEDMARVQGVNVERQRLLLMLLMAFTVAISVKLVGLLLITSLLILPAACARYFANTPQQMALMAIATGLIMVIGGLAGSFALDTPSGPSIVLTGALMFLLLGALGFAKALKSS